MVRVGWRAAVVPPAPRVPIQAPGWWATVDVAHVRQLNAGLLGKSSLLDITDSIVREVRIVVLQPELKGA